MHDSEDEEAVLTEDNDLDHDPLGDSDTEDEATQWEADDAILAEETDEYDPDAGIRRLGRAARHQPGTTLPTSIWPAKVALLLSADDPNPLLYLQKLTFVNKNWNEFPPLYKMIADIPAITHRLDDVKPRDEEIVHSTIEEPADLYDPSAYLCSPKTATSYDQLLSVLELSKVLYQCRGSEGYTGSESWLCPDGRRQRMRSHYVEHEEPRLGLNVIYAKALCEHKESRLNLNVIHIKALQKMIYIIYRVLLEADVDLHRATPYRINEPRTPACNRSAKFSYLTGDEDFTGNAHVSRAPSSIREDAPFTPRQYASVCFIKSSLQPEDKLHWLRLAAGTHRRHRGPESVFSRVSEYQGVFPFSRIDKALKFLKKQIPRMEWKGPSAIPVVPFGRLWNDEFDLRLPGPLSDEVSKHAGYDFVNLIKRCTVLNCCWMEQMSDQGNLVNRFGGYN
ncbi:uncharacterized protein N0V89_002419 [Didymosphaeria variabile]|uniref:Uncharacterized protein n=1 Tax=Didymosphaeria variabile TaxID=1932322 RepID=A0A9W8XU46_9PLEO|nr:uncharacterized protein N0V89_002419 [Didymosphaeria variabile]KAJ4357843.1 hypothetical protein N0V89_002419 [Didymosphaeria variabile]